MKTATIKTRFSKHIGLAVVMLSCIIVWPQYAGKSQAVKSDPVKAEPVKAVVAGPVVVEVSPYDVAADEIIEKVRVKRLNRDREGMEAIAMLKEKNKELTAMQRKYDAAQLRLRETEKLVAELMTREQGTVSVAAGQVECQIDTLYFKEKGFFNKRLVQIDKP